MPELSDADAVFYLPFLLAAAKEFEITTRSRMTAFIGNGAYESGEVRFMEEIGRPNKEYAPYYGRGFMQLTGLGNYRAARQYFNTDFVGQPDLVSQPEWAFRTAAWFFRNGNGDQVAFADAGNFWQCYVRTVGIDNGTFSDRRAYYDRALGILPLRP
jgi:predicted chitinase